VKTEHEREPGPRSIVGMMLIRFAGGFLVLALTAALLSLIW